VEYTLSRRGNVLLYLSSSCINLCITLRFPSSSSGATLGERITSDDITRVVACSTGIPVQSLLKGERERLVYVRHFLSIRNGT
jgi:ATP-dependent Clp protease ATP-binding subunit ClpA